MKCVICEQGMTAARATTITLERGDLMLVIENIPAQVCEKCGEAYLDEEVARRVLESAEQAASEGVEADIREYSTA